MTARWTFAGKWDPEATLPAGAAVRRRAAASRRGSGREPVSDAIALDSRAQRGVAQRAFRDEQPAAVPRCNQREAGFDPGPLDLATTYFWRVDSVTPAGIVAGADMVVHDRGDAPRRARRRLDRHRRQRLGPRLHRAAHVPRDGREHGPQRAELKELSRRGPLARGARRGRGRRPDPVRPQRSAGQGARARNRPGDDLPREPFPVRRRGARGGRSPGHRHVAHAPQLRRRRQGGLRPLPVRRCREGGGRGSGRSARRPARREHRHP